MKRSHAINRDTLLLFLHRLDESFAKPGRICLIGETSQLFEGWRTWASHVEFWGDVDNAERESFTARVEEIRDDIGISVNDESPGSVIPLPDGHETRMRDAASDLANLALCHFDPYSVAFRFIARGDEPDYHLVLMYLQHGWIDKDEMDARLEATLPRFTTETIQQDPAEFRRKYKGLEQMWRAVPPRTTHRPTPV